MKYELVDRIIRPRRGGHTDWNRKRLVVIRRVGPRDRPLVELRWHFAGKAWTDGMNGYQPVESQLRLYAVSEASRGAWQEEYLMLQEGGRLSKAAVLKHAKRLAVVFGADFAEHLDIKKTLIVRV